MVPLISSCGAKEYKINLPEINGLQISSLTIKKGEAYSGVISIDTLLVDNQFLPDKLDKVTSGNKVLVATQDYTYTLKEDRLSADFKIPAANIIGDIQIDLSLVYKAWFEYEDWWNYCSSGKEGEEATIEQVGKEVPLKVNNVDYKVRLLDVDKDILADKSGTAHCTFEFVNVIEGTVMAWNNTHYKEGSYYNYNFIDESTLNDALQPDGNVYKMMPTDLMEVVKTVTKSVDIGETRPYVFTDYDTKLFPLSRAEIFESAQEKTYVYYKGDDWYKKRIKNKAYWLRSPATTSFIQATYVKFTDDPEDYWNPTYVYDSFDLYSNNIYVSPAFCI